MFFGDWNIDIDILASPNPGESPGMPCAFQESVTSDIAFLAYSQGEIGMNKEVGMWAVFQHKHAPQVIVNPRRLLCWFPWHPDSVIFSSCETLLAVSVCVYQGYPGPIFSPTCILDLSGRLFAPFDGTVREHDGQFIHRMYRREGDAYVEYDGETVTRESLQWRDFTEIDDFSRLYLATKGS